MLHPDDIDQITRLVGAQLEAAAKEQEEARRGMYQTLDGVLRSMETITRQQQQLVDCMKAQPGGAGHGDSKARVEGIVQAMAGYVRRCLEPLGARIAELESGAAPALSYEGVFDPAKTYRRGMFVTHGGSVWHCNEPTSCGVRPGDGSTWTLAVKHGKDAR